jgi:hypothetical protein
LDEPDASVFRVEVNYVETCASYIEKVVNGNGNTSGNITGKVPEKEQLSRNPEKDNPQIRPP